MKIWYFAFIATFLFTTNIIWAQELPEGCSANYNQVTLECITKYQKEMKDLDVVIPRDSRSIAENTYFYKTSLGHLGKFTITSAVYDREICRVYIDATTYAKNKIYSPNNILTARNEYGNWIDDSIALSPKGPEDLRVTMKEVVSDGKKVKVCVLTTDMLGEKERKKKEEDAAAAALANIDDKGDGKKEETKIDSAQAIFFLNTKEQTLYTGRELLYYAALFLIGLAVYLVANAVFQEEERFKASEKLDDAESEKGDTNSKVSNDFVLKYSRPFFKRYFSPIVNGMKNKKIIRERYKRKLATAGLTRELTPEDFFAFKLFLIIGFPIVFLIVRAALEETWSLSLTPIMGLVGFFYPNIWLNGRIQRRQEELINNMPFVVDMLALSVEAGLDFMAAMQKVIEKAKGSALTEEFEIMIKETKVGASRAEGLRQLSWRTDTIQIASFTATLIAADSVGASIGPILKTLAAEMRQKRSADAEKKGATAATKILFPMMFLIMPAVAIIIMAPMLLQFMAG